MTSAEDMYYMRMALALAEKGRGTTSPNPMVGAVVVKDGVVVGRGWHHTAGEDHAEVIALKEAGELARGAVLYVTLEPCCHEGRTPPCTEAIARHGIKRVVAATLDDNPKVCGGGSAAMNRHGIEFNVGVMENEARRLNEAYFTHITTGRPFVTLKMAVTLDGNIADADGRSTWITGTAARKHVHQIRAWNDAVLVGGGTVRADNPRLTVRNVEGNSPIRVVVDTRLESAGDARVFDTPGTIVAAGDSIDGDKAERLETRGAEIWWLPDGRGGVSLTALLTRLGEREITSLLCEGGAGLATALLAESLADKVMFMIAPKLLGNGIHVLHDLARRMDTILRLDNVQWEQAGDDMICTGYPRYTPDAKDT